MIKRNIGCIFLVFLFFGCSHTDKKNTFHPFPDHIYKLPELNFYYGSRVGILEFSSPEYAGDSGQIAAELLYKELLKENIYSSLFLHRQHNLLIEKKDLARFARSQNLDLIITGKISYFLEGGNFQDSHVCQEIRVIEPVREKLYTVWHASSCEKAEYTAEKDYIFFIANGRPSASCFQLMNNIARQFANMLAAIPPLYH